MNSKESQKVYLNCKRVDSIRNLAYQHKLKIKESADTIDSLTGKRIDVVE